MENMEDLAGKVEYMHQVTSSNFETHIVENSLSRNFLINKINYFNNPCTSKNIVNISLHQEQIPR
jgi:hypothetical protein